MTVNKNELNSLKEILTTNQKKKADLVKRGEEQALMRLLVKQAEKLINGFKRRRKRPL